MQLEKNKNNNKQIYVKISTNITIGKCKLQKGTIH